MSAVGISPREGPGRPSCFGSARTPTMRNVRATTTEPRGAWAPILFRFRENANDAKCSRDYNRAFWLRILIVFSQGQPEKTLRLTAGFLLILFTGRREEFECLSDGLGRRRVTGDAHSIFADDCFVAASRGNHLARGKVLEAR